MNFNPADSANMTAVALLFQTGYLTIKGKILKDGADRYIMDSPNREVRQSLSEHVLLSYVGEVESEEIFELKPQLLRVAIDEDAKAFTDTVLAVLTRIPYSINETKNENKDEGGKAYHAMLVCSMISMGLEVSAEKITNLGRVDIVWKYGNKVFIIEVKFVDMYRMKKSKKTSRRTKVEKTPATVAKEMNKLLDAALSPIKYKMYYESYLLQKKEIVLVGIAVSTKAQDVKAKFERL
jgi:hypothetical protein